MGNKVEALENEIKDLSRDELASFRSWFVKFDAAEWDQQIENDINSGKLDQLAAKALAAHKRRESREL
ncbi:MAG: hypothetical protein OEW15_18690 [Nitrospirota bacterium]|nr:hypothetical protein [Nitrospirota bacterium]